MKLIPLTKGYHAIVDDEDFECLSQVKWSLHESCGIRYAHRRDPVIGRHVYMHREILNLGPGRKLIADHINGNGLDNRRCNLRAVTPSQSIMNTRNQSGSVSRFKGVHRERNKWRVVITMDRKKHNLGTFADEEDAARAYDAKARELFGEFARTNF